MYKWNAFTIYYYYLSFQKNSRERFITSTNTTVNLILLKELLKILSFNLDELKIRMSKDSYLNMLHKKIYQLEETIDTTF